ncbi:MAG: WYL domain-containing protein, partial [Ruminococcus sp.]|nr:WYL domain-containing protein [Ruminococcus sp.]
EYYIINRLNHEKRHGTITILKDKIVFSIKVTDPREMRPWIRSFYSRIVECSGIDTDTFHLSDEVNEYQALESHFTNLKSDTTFNTNWYIPKGTTFTLAKESESDSLFNPFFGVYFMLFGDVLSSIYKSGRDNFNCLSADAVERCIEPCYKKREQEIGLYTRRSLVSSSSKYNLISALNHCLFIKCGYMENDTWVEGTPEDKKNYVYHMKYKAVQKMEPDLFLDVIPLTAWELRWLCTILHDDKMNLFLSSDTVNKLLALIPDSIKPINVSDIVVFDRYHSKGHKPSAEYFQAIVSALHKCVRLQIKYKDGKGRKYKGTYCPLHIEYSKRDDRFRLYVVDDASMRVRIMNIDGITSINTCDSSFDPNDYQKILSDFLQENSDSITVEFFDTKNIPDRLLNEFAPWRKQCELIDPEAKLYRFTLYYYKYDEIDVLIRLMSYGPFIRFVDKDHFIYKELMKRIEKQNELFRNLEKDR